MSAVIGSRAVVGITSKNNLFRRIFYIFLPYYSFIFSTYSFLLRHFPSYLGLRKIPGPPTEESVTRTEFQKQLLVPKRKAGLPPKKWKKKEALYASISGRGLLELRVWKPLLLIPYVTSSGKYELHELRKIWKSINIISPKRKGISKERNFPLLNNDITVKYHEGKSWISQKSSTAGFKNAWWHFTVRRRKTKDATNHEYLLDQKLYNFMLSSAKDTQFKFC